MAGKVEPLSGAIRVVKFLTKARCQKLYKEKGWFGKHNRASKGPRTKSDTWPFEIKQRTNLKTHQIHQRFILLPLEISELGSLFSQKISHIHPSIAEFESNPIRTSEGNFFYSKLIALSSCVCRAERWENLEWWSNKKNLYPIELTNKFCDVRTRHVSLFMIDYCRIIKITLHNCNK
jgi:hypothetical protein